MRRVTIWGDPGIPSILGDSTWLQYGSFGILASIAVWLMYWVPKWFERSNQLREAEREQCAKNHNELQENYNSLLTAINQHLDIAMKNYEVSREVRHEVANIAQTNALQRAREQLQEKDKASPKSLP